MSIVALMLVSINACVHPAGKQPEPGNNQNAESGLIMPERIAWTNIWVEKTADTLLPRLLLIGDSHVQQYYPFVKSELEGKVNFGRLTSSKCLGNPYLEKEIKTFLEQYPCDIIAFNNGLHGKKYPDSVYAAHLPIIFKLFEKTAPAARVIWMNTTPVRKNDSLDAFDAFTQHVKKRNLLAKKFMLQNGIPIVDLWSIGYEHPEYYSDDGVHFNAKGKKAEAKKVADAVLRVLVPETK